MATLSKIICKKCTLENERNRGNCNRCNEPLGSGFPNVNVYSDSYFTDVVTKRYDACISSLTTTKEKDAIADFEKQILAEAQPVVNMDRKLFFLLVNSKEDYLPYRRAVDLGKRAISDVQNDHKRTVIDTSFYGTHGSDIVFAALSLNEKGLISYGEICVTLNADWVSDRITVFNKNSFDLYDDLTREYSWNPAHFPPPSGYFGTWNNREEITVVKYKDEVIKISQGNNNADILLKSNGNRAEDEFIELHIYKEIAYLSFLKVKLHNKLTDKKDQKNWMIAQEILEEAKISVTAA